MSELVVFAFPTETGAAEMFELLVHRYERELYN